MLRNNMDKNIQRSFYGLALFLVIIANMAVSTVAYAAEPVAFIDWASGESSNIKVVGGTWTNVVVDNHKLIELSPGRVSLPMTWDMDMPNPGFPGVISKQKSITEFPNLVFDIDYKSMNISNSVDLAFVLTVYDYSESNEKFSQATLTWADKSNPAQSGQFIVSGNPFSQDPLVRPRLQYKTITAPGALLNNCIEGGDLKLESKSRLLLQRLDVYRLPPSPLDDKESRRFDLLQLSRVRKQTGILELWQKDLADLAVEQTRAYNMRALSEELARISIRHCNWNNRKFDKQIPGLVQTLLKQVQKSQILFDRFYYDGRVALLREDLGAYKKLSGELQSVLSEIVDTSWQLEKSARESHSLLNLERGVLPRSAWLISDKGSGMDKVDFGHFANSPHESYDPYDGIGRMMSQFGINTKAYIFYPPLLNSDGSWDEKSFSGFNDMVRQELARGYDLTHMVGHHRTYLGKNFPDWLIEKAGGKENFFDADYNGKISGTDMDIWSPHVRKYYADALEALARETASNPRFNPWFCWSEIWGGTGYSRNGRQAFRDYLKNKYKDIETLNKAWGNDFADFNGINPPPPGSTKLRDQASGLTYEFEKFRRDSFNDWWRLTKESLRRGNPKARLWIEGWGRWDYLLRHGMDQLGLFDAADMASCHSGRAENAKITWMESLSRYSRTPMVDGEASINGSWKETGAPSTELLRAAAEQLLLTQIWHGFRKYTFWHTEFLASGAYSYGGPPLYDRSQFGPVSPSASAVYVVRQKADLYNDIIINTKPVHPGVGILFSSTSFINSWPYNELEHETFPIHNWLFYSDFGYLSVHEDAIIDGREDLQGFNVIIAPWAMWLRPGVAEKLLDWVRRGGVLVSSGPIGAFDQCGKPLNTILDAALGKVEVAYKSHEREGDNRISRQSLQRLQSSGDYATTHFGGWTWLIRQDKSGPESHLLDLEDGTPVVYQADVGLGRVIVSTGPLGKNGLRRLVMDQVEKRVIPLVRKSRDDGFHVSARVDLAERLFLGVFNYNLTEEVTDTILVDGNYCEVFEQTLLGKVKVPVEIRGRRTALKLTLAPGEGTVLEMGSMLKAGRPRISFRQADITPEKPLVTISRADIDDTAIKIRKKRLEPAALAEAESLLLAARQYISRGYHDRANRLVLAANQVKDVSSPMSVPGDNACAARVKGKVTIDGLAEDWRNVRRYSVRNQPDSGGEFSFQWDEQYLYVLAVVRDSDLKFIEESIGDDVNWIWTYDGILLALDSGNSSPVTIGGALYDAKYKAGQTVLMASISGRKYGAGPSGFSAASVRSAVREIKGGYIMEAAIPLADVMIPPIAGADIGFEFKIVNNGNYAGFSCFSDREHWEFCNSLFARLRLTE